MLDDYLCPILTSSAQLKLDLAYLNINITPPTQTCIFPTHSSKLGQAQVKLKAIVGVGVQFRVQLLAQWVVGGLK